jgi:hypothetical protein
MTATTVARTGITTEAQPKARGPILNGVVWTIEAATTSLDEANDAIQMGYIPAEVTLIGFVMYADDLDTGTVALVTKLTVGTTDVKTGITIGQADAKITHTLTQFLAIDPYTTTVETLVTLTVTTAAATAATGTIALTPVYIGN